jgi:hypothetical protein
MTMGSIQPLTEISARNLPGGKKRPAHSTDNLAAICAECLKMWEPQSLATLRASTACTRITLPYLSFNRVIIIHFNTEIGMFQ